MIKTLFKSFLILIFFLPVSAFGSDAENLESGNAFSQEHKRVPQDASSVPGYEGTNVSESGLTSSHIQGALSDQIQQKGNLSSFINETHDQRLRFKIDPQNDPLFTESDKVISDPLKVLKGEKKDTKIPAQTIKTTHTCEESGEPVRTSCVEERIVMISIPRTKTHRVSVEVYSHGYAGGLSKNVITEKKLDDSNSYDGGPYCAYTEIHHAFPENWRNRIERLIYVNPEPGIKLEGQVLRVNTGEGGWRFVKTMVHIDVVYTIPLRPEDIKEQITNTCQDLESKVDSGLCHYHSLETLEGPQTRMINDHSVKRDWWKRRRHYECHYPFKDTCAALKAKGCVQIHSHCQQWIDKVCVLYAQTYECVERRGEGTKTSLSGDVPYCLDGHCVDQGFAPNEDIAAVLSTLAILKTIQKDMDVHGPSVFKGESYGCYRHCINFKDCCGSGKGWGVSMSLAGCSEKEKALAELRPQKKCVYVGTYCAEKVPVLKTCLRKKSSYCCFGSKMARLIQEQGRQQLGISFGSAEHPQCRGLSVEELGKIDFTKIDLSELFEDVWSKMKAPNLEKLSQDFQESWSQRKPILEQSQKPYREHIQKEKPDAVF